MASSNRHWPSLFKSKPCNSHHQGHHDIGSSTLLKKPPHTSGTLPGCEERSPEPKPRWNPKPEQIRILEAIFNSGMVNPPRDEIRRIRAQLQEYGQVGDANVFYWFQNRKSRSKQKQRHLQAARQQQSRPTGNAPSLTTVSATTSSSSSSSERSNGSDKTVLTGMTLGGLAGVLHASNSPTASANQGFLQGEILPEPFYFRAMQQGCCFSLAEMPAGLVVVPEQALGLCAGMFSELPSQQLGYKVGEDGIKMNVLQTYHSAATVANAATAALATAATTTSTTTTTADSGANSDPTIAGHISGIIQGMESGRCGVSRSTVFINEVPFEVGAGLFNVKEAFGEDALLLHSSGHPVPVDERGVTLHPLQHGASYYLV